MKCPQSDSRSGAVIFACHCLLNANAKVCGLAKYAGVHAQLLELLARQDIGVIQLPCPEILHMGPGRWWQTRSQYDIPAYRDLCNRLAKDAADLASVYAASQCRVLGVLGVEGSPSCGVNEVYDAADWGGQPREIDLSNCRVKGSGLFVDALNAAFARRSLDIPIIGISSTAKDLVEILAQEVAKP